jgi:hypothetical protein
VNAGVGLMAFPQDQFVDEKDDERAIFQQIKIAFSRSAIQPVCWKIIPAEAA